MSPLSKTILVLIVVFLSWFQTTPALSFFGARPNLTMIFFAILAGLVSSFLLFVALLLISVLIIQNVFFFSWPTIIFLLLATLMFFWLRRLPWQTTINIFVAIVLLTIFFPLLVEPTFAIKNISIVLQELIYNLIAGTVLYGILFSLVGPQGFSTHTHSA